MIKNFLLVAFRNLWKNKMLSTINLTGLALGMAGAILLLLNIQYSISVDQFHEKKDHIYKVHENVFANGRIETWGNNPDLLGPALQKDYPEIKTTARLAYTGNLFGYGDKKLEAGGIYSDPAFLTMFTFPLQKGDAQSALNDAYSIVITEDLATRIFGNEEPLNKVLKLNNADNFTVKGVLKNLPPNTRFTFDYIISWNYLKASKGEHPQWDYYYAETYAELQPNSNVTALNNKIKPLIRQNTNNQEKVDVFLYPYARMNLYGRFENGKPAGGNISEIRLMGTLALVILLIACINFMNLGTAKSEKRAKEVGVRKVIGAGRGSLIFQFIGESILLAAIAGILAMVIVQLLLPVFSLLSKTQLSIPWTSPLFWLASVGFVVFTGILAGSYPAFYLSSFRPVKVLKGILKNGNALLTPRKVLVVIQFVLSIVLINFMFIFQKQLKHVQQRDPGFVKENLIFHPITSDLRKNFASFRNELLSSGAASYVNKSGSPVVFNTESISGFKWAGQDEKANINFDISRSQKDYVKTNGLTLLQGRDIDITEFPADSSSCLINETAARILNFKNPVGQTIKNGNTSLTIVGVIKDFISAGPQQSVKPLIVQCGNTWSYVTIRLNPGNSFESNIQKAESILKKYNPNFVSEYRFADIEYANKLRQPANALVLIRSFALIAIFISCMGLFGLTIYMAENRTREIGIRKVLGASVATVTSLLAKDFVKLVAIAIIIASPVAWWLMNAFLQKFEYRTSLDWWVLLAAGIAALLIAMATISFHSIKAAKANPVKSLRSE